MNNATPATPPAEQKTKKISKWLTIIFAVWLGYLLYPIVWPTATDKAGALAIYVEKWRQPPATSVPATPTYTLACATYRDDAVDLPNVDEAMVIIPAIDAASGVAADSGAADGCITQWVARPRLKPVEEERRMFLVYPERTVWMQKRYGDGRFGQWEEFNPSFMRRYDDSNRVTVLAMRFRKDNAEIRMKFYLGYP